MTKRISSSLCGLSLLFMVAIGSAAAAAVFEQAESFYIRGDFEQAAVEAAALKTADGYALAAQATLVNALFLLEGEPRLEAFAKALDLAKAGLLIDADHIESNLQAAGALGLQARVRNSSLLARNARIHLKTILDLDRDHALALAAIGAWHGEVLNRTGPFFGQIFFGANRKAVFENFDRAISLRPDLPSLQIAYARTLLRFPARHRGRAAALLEEAKALPTANKVEALWQVYGRLILEAMKGNDQERLRVVLNDVPSAEIKKCSVTLP